MHATSSQTPTSSSSPSVVRVLLVEDNPGDVRLVQSHLERVDPRLIGGQFEFESAGCCTEATDVLADESFDVLLLDLHLPDTTGLETVDRILPHTGRTPVVILTGMAEDETAFRAVDRGADDFVSKHGLEGKQLARAMRYAIEREQRRLQLEVVESARVGMVLVELDEPDHRVVFANSACEQLTGYPPDRWEIDGLALLDGPDTEEMKRRRLWDAARQGRTDSIEQYTTRADGSQFWCSIEAIPIMNGDAPSHILFSISDISEQVDQRAQLAKYDRMNLLFSVADGLAHEINNPLAFVRSNLEYVRRCLETPDSHEAGDTEALGEVLVEAIEGCDRIEKVIGDLQNLAGGEPDADFELTTLDPAEPVKSSLAVARKRIEDRARLICNIENIRSVRANKARLGQVVLNVLLNAVEALPTQPPEPEDHRVRIDLFDRDDDVVVSITDTGCGIPDEDLDRIWDPFYSLNKPQGTGLGLAFSRQIIERFGGDMTIESTRDEGTTVQVRLPACKN